MGSVMLALPGCPDAQRLNIADRVGGNQAGRALVSAEHQYRCHFRSLGLATTLYCAEHCVRVSAWVSRLELREKIASCFSLIRSKRPPDPAIINLDDAARNLSLPLMAATFLLIATRHELKMSIQFKFAENVLFHPSACGLKQFSQSYIF